MVDDLKPAPLPWERQAVEPEDAWQAFRFYRDMFPPRALVRCAARTTPLLVKWYNDYSWKERCAQYDAYLDTVTRAEKEAILKRTANEIAAETMGLVATVKELAQREMSKWLQASQESDAHGLVKFSDALKAVDTAIKLDRLIRGQTTENIGHEFDYSKLSIEELETLDALYTKAGVKKEEA